MMPVRQLQAILREISGKRAQAHIAQLILHDRIPGTAGFRRALEYVRAEFRKCGLSSMRIEQFRARRSLRYWTWPAGDVWEPISAELRIVEPEKEQARLTAYPDDAISLSASSGATPAAGITRRLVFVGRGDTPASYTHKPVRGNVVLMEGSGALPYYLATSVYGAAGVVRCAASADSLDFPDIAGRDRIVADPKLPRKPFGFSLPRRRFEFLKSLVLDEQDKDRKVRVFARVNARHGAGTMDVLSATIPGSCRGVGAGEFILVAHLCHPRPSANDNASGVALCLEIARVLQRLIAKRELPPPRLTLRFLVCAEWAGTIPWIVRHFNSMGNVRGAISLDMVGEDQAKCGSVLNVHASHSSSPHFLADLVCRALAETLKVGGTRLSGFKFAYAPYVGASDNAPFAPHRVGVPNVALVQWPDHYYHSTEDTLDKTSPISLEATGAATLAAFYTVSNPSLASTGTLVCEVGNRVRERLSRVIEQQTAGMGPPRDTAAPKHGISRLLREARRQIWNASQVCEHHKHVAIETLRSLSSLVAQLQVADERLMANLLLDDEARNLDAITPRQHIDISARLSLVSQGWAAAEAFHATRLSTSTLDVPTSLNTASPARRATASLLSPLAPALDRIARKAVSLTPAWAPKYGGGGPFNWYCVRQQLSGKRLLAFIKLTKKTSKCLWLGDEPIYWMDGNRSILDIWRILRAEGVPILDHSGVPAHVPAPSDLLNLLEYFRLLQDCGYIRLTKAPMAVGRAFQ